MKIPANAKRVFKGVMYDVYQWPQKMYDGSTQTFEAIKRPDTVTVIAVVDGKILIENQRQPHRAKPFLSLPGGRVDPGEEPLAAIKRELREETGYEASEWKLINSWNPSPVTDWTSHVYVARDCVRAGGQELDPGEQIELRLISLDDFLSLAEDETFRATDIRTMMFGLLLHPEKRAEFARTLGLSQ